jgi:hypothetical protein
VERNLEPFYLLYLLGRFFFGKIPGKEIAGNCSEHLIFY